MPCWASLIWGSPQKPNHSALTLLRSGLWAAPVRLGIPAWRSRQALAPVLATLKPPGPCWYLNGIGIDPSAQRTGLGSALINQMLPRIDEDALPAFLGHVGAGTTSATTSGSASW